MRDIPLTASRPRSESIEPSAIRRPAPAKVTRKAAKPRKFSLRRTGYALLFGIGALAAIGVPLNALFFQDGRHPAPLFLTTALSPPAPAPSAKPAAASQVADAPAMQIDAPKAKAETVRTPAKTESARSESAGAAKIAPKTPAKIAEPAKHDPIAQLLNGPARPKEPAESDVLMAQQALLKLGYVVRADGKFTAATRQAIEKFEHDHGLPVKGALTTKIAAQLATRAGLESE